MRMKAKCNAALSNFSAACGIVCKYENTKAVEVLKLSVKESATGYLLILPLMVGYILFYIAPFLVILYHTVSRGSLGFVGLDNFLDIFRNRTFKLASGNTVKFLAVGLPMILVLGFAIALLIKQQAKRFPILKSVVMLPYVMPVVGTMILVDVIFTETGLLSRLVEALGWNIPLWLESEHAFWIVILLYLWKNTGYCVVLLLSGLNAIPESHYDAASIDGANGFAKLRYITVPQMWYSVFFAGVFSLINAFKCFREIFLIGGTHPHDSIYILQHYINNCFQKLNMPNLSVASVLILLPLAVIFIVCYRWVMKKEAFRG